MASIVQLGQKYINCRVLIVASVVFVCASLTWQGYDFYQAIVLNKNAQKVEVAPQAQAESFNQLVKGSAPLLFGRADMQGKEISKNTIPVTKMNLLLRGVIANEEDAQFNSAIIQVSNKDKVYFIGDTITGSASLSQVHKDYVVINLAGKLEKLFFPNIKQESEIIREVKPMSKTVLKTGH